ncbi:MAG: septum formation initiator family protein [Elusimicrobiaceae bacterium]|nr:septum formation initiator family protein [Elusimicrobiaceae bacterium]
MKKFFKNKKNIFFIVIFLFLLAVFGAKSFTALIHNSFTIANLTRKSAFLDKQYQDLTEEYQEILSGKTNYIEDNARTKYNMARPTEIEFRIKK